MPAEIFRLGLSREFKWYYPWRLTTEEFNVRVDYESNFDQDDGIES